MPASTPSRGPARARHLFAASHSGRGYSTLYRHLWETAAEPHILTLHQTRPGRLSRAVRMAGRMLLELGHDVEFIHSPWRSDHLEGLAAPGLSLVVLGGGAAAQARSAAAPHIEVMDDEAPQPLRGRRALDLERLAQHEDRQRLEEVERLSRHACELLEMSLRLRGRMEQVVTEEAGAVDQGRFHAIADELLATLTQGRVEPSDPPGRVRYLFASAITGDGPRNYLERLFGPLANQYIIEGAPGIPRERFIRLVADAAQRRGLELILFPCALDPQRLEHVVVPDLQTAFISSEPPHTYSGGHEPTVIPPAAFLDTRRLNAFSEELEALRAPFAAALERAVWYLGRAAGHLEVREELVMHDLHGREAGGQRLLQRVQAIASGQLEDPATRFSGNHRW